MEDLFIKATSYLKHVTLIDDKTLKFHEFDGVFTYKFENGFNLNDEVVVINIDENITCSEPSLKQFLLFKVDNNVYEIRQRRYNRYPFDSPEVKNEYDGYISPYSLLKEGGVVKEYLHDDNLSIYRHKGVVRHLDKVQLFEFDVLYEDDDIFVINLNLSIISYAILKKTSDNEYKAVELVEGEEVFEKLLHNYREPTKGKLSKANQTFEYDEYTDFYGGGRVTGHHIIRFK